jgi:hypothetical protein
MNVEFVRRVTWTVLAALGPAAACGALLAGGPGAVGSVVGALVSLGSFRWIAGAVSRASTPGGRAGLSLSALAVGARHLAAFGLLAAALVTGAAHPLALVAGLSLLPPVVIAVGLKPREAAG